MFVHKQASGHSHELTPKQGVSYNVASVDGVDVKQDDILPQREARPQQALIDGGVATWPAIYPPQDVP